MYMLIKYFESVLGELAGVNLDITVEASIIASSFFFNITLFLK